jgi:hypothetical protein
MPGLTIQNKIINKLSGPVSIDIITPKDNFVFFMRKHGGLAPNIILLGDEHSGTEKDLCSNCSSCNIINNKNECCYNIYDDGFLELLNDYNKKYPDVSVNIYLEIFDKKILSDDKTIIENINNFKNYINESRFNNRKVDPPIYEMKTKYLPCFYSKIKETDFFKNNCKFNNINWHQTDVRMATNHLEGVLVHNLTPQVSDVNYLFPNNPIMTRSNASFTSLYKALSYIFSFKGPFNSEIITEFIRYNVNFYSYKINNSYTHNIKNIMICMKLFSKFICSAINKDNYNNFLDYYFYCIEHVFKDESLIYKQIIDQIPVFSNFSVWKDLFKIYGLYKQLTFNILDSYSYMPLFIIYFIKNGILFYSKILDIISDYMLNNISKINDLYSDTDKLLFSNDLISNIISDIELNDLYYKITSQKTKKGFSSKEVLIGTSNYTFTLTGAVFLDFYFILRILKPAQYNNKNTALCIGYFGYFHTENIKRFFTNVFYKYYDILFTKNKQEKSIYLKFKCYFENMYFSLNNCNIIF